MAMNTLTYKSAIELKSLIVRREVSPVEVVEAAIRRAEALEPTLNCFVR